MPVYKNIILARALTEAYLLKTKHFRGRNWSKGILADLKKAVKNSFMTLALPQYNTESQNCNFY